jgi:hypothetical protein
MTPTTFKDGRQSSQPGDYTSQLADVLCQVVTVYRFGETPQALTKIRIWCCPLRASFEMEIAAAGL